MSDRTLITREFVRSILNYDPETGVFTWKARSVRPELARTDNAWNSRRVGTSAGTINKGGYVAINLFGVPKYGHRLAFVFMTGEVPEFVDHINGNRSDNRWANLRPATITQNAANTKIRSDNSSGHRGVKWYPALQKWQAQIQSGNAARHLGYFSDIKDAVDAYETAAKDTFGNYRRIKTTEEVEQP